MFGSFPFTMDFAALAPFIIPIVAIVGAFTVGIVSMILKSKQEERAHRERMFLAEKGIEIPKELYASRPAQMLKELHEAGALDTAQGRPSDLRWLRVLLVVFGTLLAFIGLGVVTMLTYRAGFKEEGVNGMVPLLIGLGLLAAAGLVTLMVRQNGKGQP